MKPTFLARAPRLRWRPGAREPLVKPDARAAAPALEPDFDVLDAELLPTFHELDEQALRAQNDYRRGRILIILGSAVATALGAVQAALGGGETAIGVAEAIVAGAFAAVVAYVRGREAQKEYFTARLKAESLRGEYFLFLGRVAPYDVHDDDERRSLLHKRIVEIEIMEPA
jgi:Protein of unknown function (DUF4231)